MMEKILFGILVGIFQGFAATVVVFKQVSKVEFKKKLIFYISMIIYASITFIAIPNYLRFMLFIIVVSLVLYVLISIKNKIVILYAFNTEMIFTISEIIVSLILVLVGISSEKIVNSNFYNILANITISIFVVLIINLKPITILIKKIIQLFNKNKYLNNYFYLFLIILYLVLAKNGLEFVLKSNYYINILFIVVVIFIIVIIIKNESKTERLNEANKQMLNYVTKYEKIITDQGKANHEFRNQLMVIRGYAQMNKPDKLIEYLDSIVDDTKKTHSSYLISQLNKFPDGGIKGLLYYKLALMEDEKINYEINVDAGVKTKLNKLNTNMYNNVTKILGVLLDNAIDANKRCKEKKVIIDVTKENSKVIFSISNTYSGKIDISKIGTGYTTKGKGHGYGLRLIKDIVKSNNKLSIENCLENKYYVAKLNIIIPIKKKK